MKRKQKAAWFLSGILATVIAVSIVSPALAALTNKTIQVSTGVSLYINDQKLDPKDPNGNPVEPFILDGTTYLPVRAVSEALGVPIQWEGSTWSVYIGQHTSDTPTVMLKDLDYFSGSESIRTAINDKDNVGGTHYGCIFGGSNSSDSFNRTYLINGQYTKMDGVIYQRYENRSESGQCWLNVYGDGKLIYSYKFERGTGMKPVPFSVDLTGVLELQVAFGTSYHTWGGDTFFALGDVGLYT